LLAGHPELLAEAEEISHATLGDVSFESIGGEMEDSIRQSDLDHRNAVADWLAAGQHGSSGNLRTKDRAHLLREFVDKNVPEWRWINEQTTQKDRK
jgi:hypothetical protein